LFVAGAVNQPGESVGWGDVVFLVVGALVGIALILLGLKIIGGKRS
jgi:hypothetical protein